MDLNLKGQAIVRVCFDASLTLLTSGDCELRVETAAVLQLSSEEHVSFDPEFPGAAAAYIVRLARSVISTAESRGFGNLVVEFDGGMKLNVAPHDVYEAWGLVGPAGRRVTCMPGGEIAAWSEE